MISVDKLRRDRYVSIMEASKILGCSYSKAKEYLGLPASSIQMRNGHMKPLYIKDKVLGILKNIVRDGKYKNREEYKPYSRPIEEMTLLENGEFVSVKPTFRGRVRAMDGCSKPVPTGHYVCDKHKSEFKTRRKHYVEEYQIHT